ncbi:hypothetical protein G7068_13720 [Leucobacter viscericola]|uniref:Uncharacterized protein n=1 Tax=Leucobacter viscericola TaxID=2714935 RepID=A0A6G7XID6_9MICO|nr:hypothetical protein [Leucobacter viscericola]QIK64137.1 hypothetical protein G7068_13720 [Leucobacter viscericola]
MKPTEFARLGAYLISAATGAALAIIGGLNGDGGLVTAGVGLLGVGSLAGANITRTGSDTEDTV